MIENLLFIRLIALIMLCRTALCCRRYKTSYPLEDREQVSRLSTTLEDCEQVSRLSITLEDRERVLRLSTAVDK